MSTTKTAEEWICELTLYKTSGAGRPGSQAWESVVQLCNILNRIIVSGDSQAAKSAYQEGLKFLDQQVDEGTPFFLGWPSFAVFEIWYSKGYEWIRRISPIADGHRTQGDGSSGFSYTTYNESGSSQTISTGYLPQSFGQGQGFLHDPNGVIDAPKLKDQERPPSREGSQGRGSGRSSSHSSRRASMDGGSTEGVMRDPSEQHTAHTSIPPTSILPIIPGPK